MNKKQNMWPLSRWHIRLTVLSEISIFCSLLQGLYLFLLVVHMYEVAIHIKDDCLVLFESIVLTLSNRKWPICCLNPYLPATKSILDTFFFLEEKNITVLNFHPWYLVSKYGLMVEFTADP